MTDVATASAVPSSAVAMAGHGPATRPNMVAVGTIVWLSSELMFFAGLFAVYFQLRSVRGDLWAQQVDKLNLPFASVNCLVLVVSSVWCQLGVWKAERGQKARTGSLFDLKNWGMREWYVLTYLFGSFFIAGQVMEYAELVHQNVTLSSDRVPRSPRDRWPARLPAHHRAHLHDSSLHARERDRSGCHVVLLALRRRRVDRALCHHLHPPMTSTAPRAPGPTSATCTAPTDDRTSQ